MPTAKYSNSLSKWASAAYSSTTAVSSSYVIFNGTTSSTPIQHFAGQLTPQVVLGPPIAIKECKHEQWNLAKQQCDGCFVTAEAIASAQLKHRLPMPRAFNKYVNASDLMEEFIRFLGEHKVKQGEVLNLPMELFIKWLIIQACEADDEEPNVTLELPSPKKHTKRCLGCRKFIPKMLSLPFHNEKCGFFYFSRVNMAAIKSE